MQTNPISADAVDLGLILKNMDFRLDMHNFSGRLSLQKLVYFLQIHGVYLGYDFSYYLHGPYCSKLSSAGFDLQQIYNTIQKSQNNDIFLDKFIQKNFEQAKKNMSKFKSVDELEIGASLHLLSRTTNLSKKEIIEKVASKEYKFTIDQCEKIWCILEQENLIKRVENTEQENNIVVKRDD